VDLDLVFFGTSGSMPTARRAPSALLVRRGSERLLFDCAEGTQRQMLRSTVGLVELREIFLTHYHADHFLGLPGMLKTFALRGREVDLTVYGPSGLLDLFAALKRIFGKLTYGLHLEELEAGDVLGRDEIDEPRRFVQRRHNDRAVVAPGRRRSLPGAEDTELPAHFGLHIRGEGLVIG
jgi:ribonuclease Z